VTTETVAGDEQDVQHLQFSSIHCHVYLPGLVIKPMATVTT